MPPEYDAVGEQASHEKNRDKDASSPTFEASYRWLRA
jgi:hypothetical protein